MGKFGKSSFEKLSTCHIDLQTVFFEVVKYFDCSIICGERTELEQNKAFDGGFSKVRFPFSKHNSKPSMAADVIPYPIDWKDVNRMRFFAGYVQGVSQQLFNAGKITHLVKWGGDWDADTELNDQRFNDFPHFELIQ